MTESPKARQGRLEKQLADVKADVAKLSVEQLRERLIEMEFLFYLRWDADRRAIARWHAKVGRELIMPDHCDMVVWLLDNMDEAQEKRLMAELPIGDNTQSPYTDDVAR